MTRRAEAMEMLRQTSRTFYIPIARLPDPLRDAVASAYLCMRAIDEIEDHPALDNITKAALLRTVSLTLQAPFQPESFSAAPAVAASQLPEVSRRMGDWALLAPAAVAPRVWDATAAMADRMASWAERGWRVETVEDLDRYTFGVAGAVGILLSDLWGWYDGTQTDRQRAIGFGRGLQAVNILRNRADDLARGVDFFPTGWGAREMQSYARQNLRLADEYTAALPPGPIRHFCAIPLALAHATVETLGRGGKKLSRAAVQDIVERATASGRDSNAIPSAGQGPAPRAHSTAAERHDNGCEQPK